MNEENPNINYPEFIEKKFEFIIPPGKIPERLDLYLTNSIRNASRTKVQRAITEGHVTVNSRIAKGSRKIHPGDIIRCSLMKPPPIELIPENIPLNIIFEDDYLLVVNKPAGMVTHPGFGNRYGTLVNAVLYHTGLREPITFEFDDEDDDFTEYIDIYSTGELRPGVVHRLDKDTSGLLVVSKNPVVHAKLAEQFANRTIERTYNALVWGKFENNEGTIHGNIGRSPRDRKLFTVVNKDGKHAVTNYNVLQRFEYLTLLELKLQTGRTHQIRVHCLHIGHPVFGDQSYNGNRLVFGNHNPQFRAFAENRLKEVKRQLLHARTLGFVHPVTSERMSFSADLPDDFSFTISLLQNSFQ